MIFYVLTGIFSIALAMFFLMNCSSDRTKSAPVSTVLAPWLCMAGIGMLLLLLAFSYFDMTVTLNGPFTTPLIFATLFGSFFFLMEAREKIGRAIPRLHLTLALTAFFLCTSVGVSNLVFSLLGDVTNGVSISESARPVLLLSVTFSAVARLLCFAESSVPAEQSEETAE